MAIFSLLLVLTAKGFKLFKVLLIQSQKLLSLNIFLKELLQNVRL